MNQVETGVRGEACATGPLRSRLQVAPAPSG
jgi:hypothetical protein